MRISIFEAPVCGANALPPAHDAVSGMMAGARQARCAVARSCRSRATEHLLREGGFVRSVTFLVGAVLSEHRNVPHVVGCYDDVAAGVG